MTATEPTAAERIAAKARLAAIEDELELACEWLDAAGWERSAIMLEDAQKAVAAAGWEMERDVLRRAAMIKNRVSPAYKLYPPRSDDLR
jgi:hypothetical protein